MGCSPKKEHSPVHFLKREDVSLEGEEADRQAGSGKKWGTADYISGKKSNPHAEPAPKTDKFYEDHGRGRTMEDDEYKDEDRIQKGKTHYEPRMVDEGAMKRKKYGFPDLSEPYEEED